MPIHDWQFWVATLIALGALWVVLRMVAPPGILPRFLRRGPRGRRTSLTVKGKPLGDHSQDA